MYVICMKLVIQKKLCILLKLHYEQVTSTRRLHSLFYLN